MKKTLLILFLSVVFCSSIFLTMTNRPSPSRESTIETNISQTLNPMVLGDVEENHTVPVGNIDITFLNDSIWTTEQGVAKLYKLGPGAQSSWFDIGHTIAGMTTDGTYIWVSSYTFPSPNGTIAKYDTSGNLVSLITVPLHADFFYGLAWDGTNLWASQMSPNCLVCIDPNTGAVLKNFSTSVSLYGLTWYDNRVWGVDNLNDRLVAIDPSSGRIVEACDGPASGLDVGLAFNGTHFLWLNYDTGRIYYLDIPVAICETYNQYDAPGIEPRDLTWNGTHYFVCDSNDDKIYILENGTFTTVGEISLGFTPGGIAVADNILYISNFSPSYAVHKYTTAGVFVATYASIGIQLESLEYDGTNLWAMGVDENFYKLSLTDASMIAIYSSVDYTGFTYDWKNKVFWAVDSNGNKIRQLDPSTFAPTGVKCDTPTSSGEYGLIFNGEHLLMTSFDTDLIYKIIIGLPTGGNGGIPGFPFILLLFSVLSLACLSFIKKKYL